MIRLIPRETKFFRMFAEVSQNVRREPVFSRIFLRILPKWMSASPGYRPSNTAATR